MQKMLSRRVENKKEEAMDASSFSIVSMRYRIA
jgi:hypothetical protein